MFFWKITAVNVCTLSVTLKERFVHDNLREPSVCVDSNGDRHLRGVRAIIQPAEEGVIMFENKQMVVHSLHLYNYFKEN